MITRIRKFWKTLDAVTAAQNRIVESNREILTKLQAATDGSNS